jgi:hypothetical protein
LWLNDQASHQSEITLIYFSEGTNLEQTKKSNYVFFSVFDTDLTSTGKNKKKIKVIGFMGNFYPIE